MPAYISIPLGLTTSSCSLSQALRGLRKRPMKNLQIVSRKVTTLLGIFKNSDFSSAKNWLNYHHYHHYSDNNRKKRTHKSIILALEELRISLQKEKQTRSFVPSYSNPFEIKVFSVSEFWMKFSFCLPFHCPYSTMKIQAVSLYFLPLRKMSNNQPSGVQDALSIRAFPLSRGGFWEER